MRMGHIIMCSLSGSTIVLYLISQTSRFSKEKKSYWTQIMRCDFLYNFLYNICLKYFPV